MTAAPLLNTIKDTAQRLGVSRTTVYNLIEAGELQRVKVGKRAVITEASLIAYVEKLTKGAS